MKASRRARTTRGGRSFQNSEPSLESASLVRSENKNADTEKNPNSDYIARE